MNHGSVTTTANIYPPKINDALNVKTNAIAFVSLSLSSSHVTLL